MMTKAATLAVLDTDTYANGDPTTFGLPLDQFDYIRDNEPCYLQEFDDPMLIEQAWVVSRNEDIWEVDRNQQRYAADRGYVNMWRVTPIDPTMGGQPAMLTSDGESHRAQRQVMSKGFTPKVVARLEEKFREYAVEIVDQALDKREFNFVQDIGHAMPMEALGDFLGVPKGDRAKFFAWVDTFAAPFDTRITPSFDYVMEAIGNLMVYSTELAELKRKNPGDDVMSRIVMAGAEAMSEDEIMGNVALLASGAAESTRTAMSHGMHEMMRNPTQMAWLRDRQTNIPSTAIQEIVRIASPFTHLVRTATEDHELQAQQISEGDAGQRGTDEEGEREPGEVVVVGDEVHHPYDRPPLSKQLLGGTYTREQCLLPGSASDVTWRLGVAVEGIDREASEIVLADGERVAYDGLIIATGPRARAWPGQLPATGVHTMRSFEDVVCFEHGLTPEAKVVIIGAGFIGCEVAATLRSRDIDVTITDVSEHPMPVLGAEAGRRAVALHESHGVKFHLGFGVKDIEGVDRVTAVVGENGERLEADVVLVAIGSEPNSGWLVGSGILLDRGVVVCDATGTVLDESGEPIDSIMAAGDIAAWPHPHASGAVCIEHWSNARDTGDAAAANILEDHAYRRAIRSVPAFWSDQYDVKIKSAGFLRGADEFTLISEDLERRALLIEASLKGQVVGAIAFNMNRAMMGYQRDLSAASV